MLSIHQPDGEPPLPLPVFLWRELRIGVPLCIGIAGFMSLMFRDPFAPTLVYSLCIGLAIQALIEGGRFGMSAWLRRHRPQHITADRNWPGWSLMGPWLVVATLCGYVGGAWLGGSLIGRVHADLFSEHNLRSLTLVMVVSLVASVGITAIFYARGRLAWLAAQAEVARRAAAETQLMLLQSQLEPHMLFNTLANLRVLIGLDPVQAQAMLDRLIAFLRATLAASRSTSHPLANEFDRIGDYLALMAVRMGPRLAVTLDLPDDLRTLPVPPLLLQPLVENSIQHGLEPKVEGGRIEVRARRADNRLLLTVQDTGVGLNDAASTQGIGFGTTQIRERLAALFGGTATFTLQPAAAGGTLAEIHLPITPPIATT